MHTSVCCDTSSTILHTVQHVPNCLHEACLARREMPCARPFTGTCEPDVGMREGMNEQRSCIANLRFGFGAAWVMQASSDVCYSRSALKCFCIKCRHARLIRLVWTDAELQCSSCGCRIGPWTASTTSYLSSTKCRIMHSMRAYPAEWQGAA